MSYFGTDGIRKKAEELTPALLKAIAKGLADYAESLGKDGTIKVLLGGDTRESTEWILSELETDLESLGLDFGSVGVFPTPGISHVFYEMGFDFAIDVTASHNPWTDNGIKIMERGKTSGIKLSEKGREFVDKAIDEKIDYKTVAVAMREDLHDEAVDIYKKHLESFAEGADFTGLKIGLDCANGATGVIGGEIFEKLGAKVFVINNDTNYGRNINNDCGSTHIETIAKFVVENNLDFGMAFDGDGDRILMVDKNGQVVDGDEMIVIVAEHLGLDKVAATVMANQGLLEWAKKKDVYVEVTPVGDSHVAAAMREKNILIGGEQNGHVVLPHQPTGDGMATGLMISGIIAKTGKGLDELAAAMKKLPQVTINITASAEQKETLKNSESAKKILLEYNEKLATISGRLLVRPSGTEALVRITMWGEDETKIQTLVEELADALKGTL